MHAYAVQIGRARFANVGSNIQSKQQTPFHSSTDLISALEAASVRGRLDFRNACPQEATSLTAVARVGLTTRRDR
jgi:hypothetical protein